MNINIIFLEDEHGNPQVADCIKAIRERARYDDNYHNLSIRIARILKILKEVGVPHLNDRVHVTTGHRGQTITLVDYVKELNYHPPLLEMRANWKPPGAFRAIFFFEIDRFGNQYIYFTQAVIKEKTSDPEFQRAVVRSEKMLRDFYRIGKGSGKEGGS